MRRKLQVEPLEGRSLLALVVSPIAAIEGTPFNGRVAGFDVGDLPGTLADFRATIVWGDGRSTAGVVTARPQDGFDVSGSNVFATQGVYPVGVTVTGAGGISVTAFGQATIADAALSVFGRPIEATAEEEFVGAVATFADAYPNRSPQDYVASIIWGDGRASTGTVSPLGGGNFQVTGTHTYETQGDFTVDVEVVRVVDGQRSLGVSPANVDPAQDVPPPPISAIGRTIVPIAGTPFREVVASFETTDTSLKKEDFVAVVDWGDGHTSKGEVIQDQEAPGRFLVFGSNTYESTGNKPLVVSVVQLSTGLKVVATGQAAVVDPFLNVTGGLSPLSDSGPFDFDGVTNNTQPTFRGTAEPFALVRLFLQRSDAETLAIGQAVAGADGSWFLSAGPLADGVYRLTAFQTPPGGYPRAGVVVLQRIIIDKVAPRVVRATYVPLARRIDVIYRDDLSGMAPAGLINPLNYSLIGSPRRRLPGPGRPQAFSVSTLPSDPEAVRIQLEDGRFGRRGPTSLRIVPGGGFEGVGVGDLAGNPLGNAHDPAVRTGGHQESGPVLVPLASVSQTRRSRGGATATMGMPTP